ncbi:MAG: hypothetical protein C5B51_31430 [Terriglobia bacterium]|nr:MAG: hypothetical protein C5B51_31430 [Terriglobia bacterium]
MKRKLVLLTTVAAAAAWFIAPVRLPGQGRGGAPAPPASPREGARFDPTGYWVSVVTEDWRFRMITPPKGDYASVPLNPEGRRVADTWDPAKDEREGNQCKSYGAANIMRVPGRVHITWQDDNTLKLEMDAGTQTRLFHFGAGQPPAGEPAWQGYSMAEWEGGPVGRGGAGGGGGGGTTAQSGPGATREAAARGGSLKVVTTHLRSGYLRKNGVPYSDKAVMTEYYDRTTEENGDSWLVVTTIVDDPQYLQQPFITSTHFKREADGSKWSPTACTAR